MVARANTVAFQGIEVIAVDVQVQMASGLPAFTLASGAVVAAVVAVNAYGGVRDYRSGRLIAGPRREDGQGFDDPVELCLLGSTENAAPPLTNTTIGLVATDAALTKEDANYLAGVSHDGLALHAK